MKSFFLFFVCLFVSCGLSAQKKLLSAQELRERSVRITESVLQVERWDATAVYLTCVDKHEKQRRNVVVDIKKKAIVRDETVAWDSAAAASDAAAAARRPESLPADAVNPVFSPDSAYIAFTRRHDLYTLRVADRKETRLTFDGSDVVLNGHASWVYMEEILGRAGRYRAFWWSPDSRRIAFFRTDDSAVPLFTLTDSPGKNGYVETLRYPKAGDSLPQVRVGVVAPDGGAVVWSAALPPNGDAPDTAACYGEAYWGLPYWRPDGRALWLQWLNRGQDDYKLLEMDVASGALRELYREQQSTWISIDSEPRIHFLESGRGFIMASDKSGWNHLYLHDMNGQLRRQLTAGSYTVLRVLGVDEPAQTVYFTCYKDHLGCEDFYRIGLNGKNLQRLSFGHYTHRPSLSDDKKYFVTTYSNVETPRKVALYNTKGQFLCTVQDTRTARFDEYERPQTDFVVLKSDDGRFDLPLRVTWPTARTPGETYPVKVAVYGGPGHPTVRNEWSDNFGDNTYRLAQAGLIQVSIDHRGSGHNGKTGQNQMHRRLGFWEIQDYTQCLAWLTAHGQADPEKVLITGYSYGGYITCYALACGGGVFTHGIAGGSVTDWLLYDAIYTERYMDAPDENPEGYKESSALTHAGRIQGKLLLTHGLRDENVHAQHTFQLVSLLEDLQKPFLLMIYPESRHGYKGKKQAYSNRMDRDFIYRELGISANPPID
jgi:dipeptidyl-peptidase-4